MLASLSVWWEGSCQPLEPPKAILLASAKKGAVAVGARLGVACRERGCADDPVKIHVASEIQC